MKFVVSRIDLLNLINKIQAVVPSKPALPVLNNVLLEAKADGLTLSTTDLTVSMQATCEAQIHEEGAVTLPAKKLFQLTRELTSSHIEIETSVGEIAKINAGSSHFKMSGMHQGEFPLPPSLQSGVSLDIDNTLLKEMLIRSSFAAARDDNRQILNGTLLELQGDEAIFTATDGKRLCRLYTKIESNISSKSSYVIPLRAIEEMIRLIDVKEGHSTLSFFPDRMGIAISNITLTSKLLNGQYPDVNKVIPQKSLSPLILHREELIALLRQISLFTTEHSSAVKFTFSSGELHLTAMSSDLGEGSVSMSVNYGGPKLDIAFNPQFFLDILRHSKDETVHLSITDAFSPGLITDSTSSQFVLMPMRLDS
ncbi:DNA polymerase III subunit beta [Rhabdochlamydiaceae symbiont of Dictyostelium giganteum]|uniref:DNA polymerase III subunit beta n=1 Tax=Rhabdochlamydiaceae symbiont of Dictyostelium giganteum TaxID=3342349 RepID=UPI00384FA609